MAVIRNCHFYGKCAVMPLVRVASGMGETEMVGVAILHHRMLRRLWRWLFLRNFGRYSYRYHIVGH
jgi:hypothetical protein